MDLIQPAAVIEKLEAAMERPVGLNSGPTMPLAAI